MAIESWGKGRILYIRLRRLRECKEQSTCSKDRKRRQKLGQIWNIFGSNVLYFVLVYLVMHPVCSLRMCTLRFRLHLYTTCTLEVQNWSKVDFSALFCLQECELRRMSVREGMLFCAVKGVCCNQATCCLYGWRGTVQKRDSKNWIATWHFHRGCFIVVK